MTLPNQSGFNVGGVRLSQPFKIRRLGHFGFNLVHMAEGVRFYTELLGFKVSDHNDPLRRVKDPSQFAGLGDPKGYFMRYGSDHHSLVLFNKRVREALDTRRRFAPGVTINQITWQVGSLREVHNAMRWLGGQGIEVQRSGRDMPGSNWHTYIYDPDGHTNELYYGIEQIGWSGHSKPRVMYSRAFREPPDLPQISEYEEVQQALHDGVDLISGYRYTDPLPASFDVDGILLPRPFKIVRIGPLGLFVKDVATAEAFYRDKLGFLLTEEVSWRGYRCVFLRCNTEHHSLALCPLALREQLGLSDHTTCMTFGLQLANYEQLRNAVSFLRQRGARINDSIPAELHPGMDYVAHVLDPDGHCLQLYYYMEQVGWDGKPRPQELRRKVTPGDWPESVEGATDVYWGEPFFGPWG